MENKEIRQLAAEVEADQERIHTKDLTQEQKISLRLQSVKEAQLIPYAASKKSIRQYSLQYSNKICNRKQENSDSQIITN